MEIPFVFYICGSGVGIVIITLSFDMFTTKEILQVLNLAGYQNEVFIKKMSPQTIKCFFPFDLEHPYYLTAGSRIHLYGDNRRWAIVGEKNGYNNRSYIGTIELVYFGNCIDYPKDDSVSNNKTILLIDFEELFTESAGGRKLVYHELIPKDRPSVSIQGHVYNLNHDFSDYEKLGIEIKAYENPEKRIDFGSLIRYIQETNPDLIAAGEEAIFEHLPKDLPKLMTITDFHYESIYEEFARASKQELYQLIAKVLVTKDTAAWQPSLPANNHWSNRVSGRFL